MNEEEYVDRGDIIEDEDSEEIEEIEEVGEDVEDQEEDGEDDDDSSESEEEEEEPEPPQKPIKIPKARLDEVVRQREEARDRVSWLEEQLEKLISNQTKKETKTTEPTYDFDLAEETYINLIIEGDVAKASKLRQEINAKQREHYQTLLSEIEDKATSKAKGESSAYIEHEKFVTAISNMESKYPYLDADSKQYNEEAVDTVNTLLAGYIAAGKTKIEALALAVKKVVPMYEQKSTKSTLGSQRKTEAGKKAAQAAKQQPTKTKSTSTKSVDMDVVNVAKMSERDFKKLSAKEKSILRGD